MKRRLTRLGVLIAAQLLLPAAGLAQSTTGALMVQVMGPDGRPLGATVRVTGIGHPLERDTDTRGWARLGALPAGSYDLDIRSIGYRAVRIPGVVVRLGQTTYHGIALRELAAPQLEPLVVEAAPRLDVTSTVAGATLRRDEFALLPVARDYHAIATLLPHANVSYLGDAMNVAGATGLENAFFVDGVDVTDVMGVRPLGTRLPYNFIGDVVVRTGGYEAEHRSSLGGTVNVVTPSGTDTLRGELFAFGIHNKLAATARQGVAQPQTRGAWAGDMGATLNGPLVRGRLWFFLAYGRALVNDEVLLPGAGFHRDRETQHSIAGKLTWQPDTRTALSVSLFGDPSERGAVGSTFGGYGAPLSFGNPEPALGRLQRGGVALALEGRRQLNQWLMLRLAASHLRNRDRNEPSTARGVAEWPVDDLMNFTRYGGYPEMVRYDTRRIAVTGTLSATLRDHAVKVGADYVHTRLQQDATMRMLVLLPDTNWFEFLSVNHGTVGSRMPGVFVQDDWRVGDRLTLKVGVRWGGQQLVDSRGLTAVSITDQWQPRVGLVYQPGRPGTQKLFASFGRYYQDLHLAASGLYHDSTGLFRFSLFDHDPRTDTTGRLVTYLGVFETDRGIRGQYDDEWTIGYERLIGAGMVLTSRAMFRRLGSGVEDGIDATTGVSILGNPGRGRLGAFPRMRREYRALELTVSGRPRPAMWLLASYVLSRARGNFGGLYNADFGYLYANRNGWWDHGDEPQQFSTGDLPNDRRHVAKVAGTWQPHVRWRLGGVATWSSGTPLNELGASVHGAPYAVFLRPRGTAGRLPSVLDANIHVGVALRSVTRSVRPTLSLDLLHLGTGRKAVAAVQQRYLALDSTGAQSAPNPAFGLAAQYAPPPSARLGVSLAF